MQKTIQNPHASIAIVGMAARFAGAWTLHDVWRRMLDGGNLCGAVPADRWNFDVFYDPNLSSHDTTNAPAGGFIEDIRSFPALAFNIPPRQAEVMDPQQRLALELSVQALENGGMFPGELPDDTGVYIGVTAVEYRTLLASRVISRMMASGSLGRLPDYPQALAEAVENVSPARPFTAAGVLSNMVAATVAQQLGLKGPAYSVDAACASGLVTVAEAVTALRNGIVDLAVAGGVYLCVTPEHHIAFSQLGALSKSGVCRPFDADADGFVQGDGCGIVVLKRLDDAIRDNNLVYAVVNGVAVNNDGGGEGAMAPVFSGQVDVIRKAWRDSGLTPDAADYIEAHGTGTDLGDRTEIAALEAVFRGRSNPVDIGSSKANFGHTQSAAGIAGLIRAALAIHYQYIPPMANFKNPRAELAHARDALRVPEVVCDWPREHRVAGVSSFGFGGTNVHAVLGSVRMAAEPRMQPELVLMSAPDMDALRRYAAEVAEAILLDRNASVAGVARMLAGRRRQPARLAAVATEVHELVEALRMFATGRTPRRVCSGVCADVPRLAFLFPGQVAPRVALLSGMRPRFATVAKEQDEIGTETESIGPLNAQDHSELALFASSVALSRQLSEVGVRPSVVLGQGTGEFVAATIAGMIAVGDGARFVVERRRRLDVSPVELGDLVASLPVDDAQCIVASSVIGQPYRGATDLRDAFGGISGSPDRFADGMEQCIAHGANLFLEVASAGPIRSMARAAIGDRKHDVLTLCPGENPDSAESLLRGLSQLWIHGVDVDPAAITGAAIPVSLSPTILPREIYWAVGDGPRVKAAAPGSTAQVQPVAPARDVSTGEARTLSGDASSQDPPTLEALIFDAVAQVSELPRDALHSWMSLTDDLGMDSILATELALALEERFDFLDGVLHDLLLENPTIADLVDFARNAQLQQRGGDIDTPADAKTIVEGDRLAGFVPCWRADSLRPGLCGLRRFAGSTVRVEGCRGRRFDAIIECLRSAGAAIVTEPSASTHPVDILVYTQADAAPTDMMAILEGREDVPFATSDLVRLLADSETGQARPDLVVVVREGGFAPSYSALARCHAVAAPNTFAKTIHVSDDLADEALASAVRLEYEGCDETWDVLHSSSGRYIQSATPCLEPITPWRAGVDDVVMITGAGGHIGHLLAERLLSLGAHCLLTGRGQVPPDTTRRLIERYSTHARYLVADVQDPESLRKALTDAPGVSVLVHAAGPGGDATDRTFAADGGDGLFNVKVRGFVNAIRACGPTLESALAIGSLAGRYGNRAQAIYATTNAALSSLAMAAASWNRRPRIVVSEFGPWSQSTMMASVATPVRHAMQRLGVEFVDDAAGVDALLEDIGSASGLRIRARHTPIASPLRRIRLQLSLEQHRYLSDHMIRDTPVLPFAMAMSLMSDVAQVQAPFEMTSLHRHHPVRVPEPVTIELGVCCHRVELHLGARSVAYSAEIRPAAELPVEPDRGNGPQAPRIDVAHFYRDATFHGPMLQGIVSIDAQGPGFIQGRVAGCSRHDWITDSTILAWAIDPLVLDSAMQLAGAALWNLTQRSLTPVSIDRYAQYQPFDIKDNHVCVYFDEKAIEKGDFAGDIFIRGDDGRLLAAAIGVRGEVIDLHQPVEDDEKTRRACGDIASWPEYQTLKKQMVNTATLGIANPFFDLHEGVAGGTSRIDGRQVVNFSSYNYLGLSGDQRVNDAVTQAIARYGTSVSASRIVSGERPIHRELESALAHAHGAQAAIVFASGHSTNVSTIGHLFGEGDLIIHDEFIHDSCQQGIRLSGATRRAFRHGDTDHLETLLRDHRESGKRCLILIEGVYSMDGDIAELPEYVALKERYDCMLMVDEAHSFGVIGRTGRGIGEYHGVDSSRVDIWMGTLSKSLASMGGWVAGSCELIEYLRYTASGFVFAAGIAPSLAQAALTALQLMVEEPWRIENLQRNCRIMQQKLSSLGVNTGAALGESPVIPVVTGSSLLALRLSEALLAQNINAKPIIFPAVSENAARLRLFVTSSHTHEQLIDSAQCIASTLANLSAADERTNAVLS